LEWLKHVLERFARLHIVGLNDRGLADELIDFREGI
jgi:hypothetical protein